MHEASDFDIAVVGCGPGGAMAGMAAAERGLRVAMLERHTHFGQKLCAGAVPADIWSDFTLDNTLAEHHIRRVDTFDASTQSWSSVPMHWGATVSRRKFDTYLVGCAERMGAELFKGCLCTELSRISDGVHRLTVCSGQDRFYLTTRIIILADGFRSLAPKVIQGLPPLNSTEIMVATQVEIEAVVKTAYAKDALLLFFDPQLSPIGYAWCFPKQHGFTVGVGCLLSHALKGLTVRSLHKMLDDYAPLQHLIERYRQLEPFRSACIPVRQRTTLCDHGVMLVGDAAGQVAPLSGEGISYAMRAGQLAGQVAAEAMCKGEVSHEQLVAYEQRWYELHGKQLQTQRHQLEVRLMAHRGLGRRVAGIGRFSQFGPYAEIVAQFPHLTYPIKSSEELITQCGGITRTFLFQGKVLRLSEGLARLPESIFPLKSWSDLATKMQSWFGSG